MQYAVNDSEVSAPPAAPKVA